MTKTEENTLRELAEPHMKHESFAVIAERLYTNRGIFQNVGLAALDRLVIGGFADRQRQGPGKFRYRRSEAGQAHLAQAVAV